MIKLIAVILAVILVFAIGYVVIGGVINIFHGYGVLEAFQHSAHDITHLWGLIKDKVEADIVIPMTNSHITWTYAQASIPR